MANEYKRPSTAIDRRAYSAAIHPQTKIERSKLIAGLNSISPGSGNTLLHLAACAGNLTFFQLLQPLDLQYVKATNLQGDTALHLAAQGGFSGVVELLLQHIEESDIDVLNKNNETALFKACESGDLDTVKHLLTAYPSSLFQKTVDGQTCLSVAINRGDSDLVDYILKLPRVSEDSELIQEKDKFGDTALHRAVGRNYLHIIQKLIAFDPELCYCVNDNDETPVCLAAKLGRLEAVKEFIKCRPDAVERPNSCGMNVLHLAAQVSQVRIVDYLNKTVCLSYLANQGVKGKDPSSETEPRESGGNTDRAKRKDPSSICQGDTPLHIAARNRHSHMVDSLLRIPGIKKHAFNNKGLTAVDVARENTEYYESHNIIAMLSSYPSKQRPFLYSAPTVTAEKNKVATEIVNETFESRRKTELVVAALLATMSFTAAFGVPGGFNTDRQYVETDKMLGSPIMIGYFCFRLFLICDCVAFYLSLFVLLMWQMSSPLTTGNKMLFMCVTNIFLCSAFAFMAYGFMAAVYTMLAHRTNTLAWSVLGICTLIGFCGNLAFFFMAAKFVLKNARFNRLIGVHPFFPDHIVEYVWMKLESWGLMDLVRCGKRMLVAILQCNFHEARAKPNGAFGKCSFTPYYYRRLGEARVEHDIGLAENV